MRGSGSANRDPDAVGTYRNTSRDPRYLANRAVALAEGLGGGGGALAEIDWGRLQADLVSARGVAVEEWKNAYYSSTATPLVPVMCQVLSWELLNSVHLLLRTYYSTRHYYSTTI